MPVRPDESGSRDGDAERLSRLPPRLFKTKLFARWARRAALADVELAAAMDEVERGLVDADLGSGLLKKRVARRGGGKRGGFRTIIAIRRDSHAFFVEGFAKSERDNLEEVELVALRKLAQFLFSLDESQLERAVTGGDLAEIDR